MKKYRLHRPRRPVELPWQERPTAIVWIDSPDYDTDGTFCMECADEHLAQQVYDAIHSAYGSRGRPLSSLEPFSPRDLACALYGRWVKHFEPEDLEPDGPAEA